MNWRPLGVPAIYLGLTPDHARSASAFADAGMGISLGVAASVSDEDILRSVRGLMGDSARRRGNAYRRPGQSGRQWCSPHRRRSGGRTERRKSSA